MGGGDWRHFYLGGRLNGFRVSEFQSFRVSGFQGFRFQGFRVSEFQGLPAELNKGQEGGELFW